MKTNTCCFIGHRRIFDAEHSKEILFKVVEKLITEEKVDTFLFGSKSQFNTLCLNVVTEIKEKYPYIKRVYVRAEYPFINENYKKYLLQTYEDTYYPEKIRGSGKVAYIERNYEMINKSDVCVMCYDEDYILPNRKSGTRIALKYAKKQGKRIINIG